jgi:hypothetical protein
MIFLKDFFQNIKTRSIDHKGEPFTPDSHDKLMAKTHVCRRSLPQNR